MAATVFTTWSALYTAMLDAMADFAAKRMQIAEYEINSGGINRRFKYRSFDELQKGLEFVKRMADQENPATAAVGRTYAKQGGGGRW